MDLLAVCAAHLLSSMLSTPHLQEGTSLSSRKGKAHLEGKASIFQCRWEERRILQNTVAMREAF